MPDQPLKGNGDTHSTATPWCTSRACAVLAGLGLTREGYTDMVTADQIRARIQAADEKRIVLRAEWATSVAELHQQVADKQAELAALTAALGDATRNALEVMSVDELAEFADLPRTELTDSRRPRAGAARPGSTRRRGKKGTTKSAPVPDSDAASASASAGTSA